MSLLSELKTYLFPPVLPSARLPLLPRTYISRELDTPGGLDTRYLKARAVARTTRAAGELIEKHPEKRLSRIARIERRKRRREPRLKKAIRKLRELW
jgi:hypothetical protein